MQIKRTAMLEQLAGAKAGQLEYRALRGDVSHAAEDRAEVAAKGQLQPCRQACSGSGLANHQVAPRPAPQHVAAAVPARAAARGQAAAEEFARPPAQDGVQFPAVKPHLHMAEEGQLTQPCRVRRAGLGQLVSQVSQGADWPRRTGCAMGLRRHGHGAPPPRSAGAHTRRPLA